MRTDSWLIINKNGIHSVRKTKPSLGWNEIAMKVHLEIPDELFQRPSISATLKVENVPLKEFDPQVIVDTAELVEQQTGAKIDFTVIYKEENEK